MPSQFLKNVFDFCLQVYRVFFRPTYGNACCFQPSCSQYCQQAVHTHGILKGSVFTLGRLLKCHPLSKGGFDPIPIYKDSTAKRMGVH